MSLHTTIRLLRESKNWTQEEMAQKLSISESGYAHIERGNTRLLHSKLEKIAEVLNVKLSDLIELAQSQNIHITDNNSVALAVYQQDISFNGTQENELLKQELTLKNELIKQKDSEIQSLKKLVALLEKQK